MAKSTNSRSLRAWGNFRQRVAELGGEVLELEWLGSHAPHRCRCANGHDCTPNPSDVGQGHGMCRVCAGNDPTTAWKNFCRLVTEQGGVVLEPEYRGSGMPHLIRCAYGHE